MRPRSLLGAAAAGLLLAAGTVTLGAGPAAAAANPDPAHVTDESWWLMEQLQALQPGTENGGQYTDKPGYHNTRAGNDADDYSVRDAEDQGGPADKTAAYDWTFPDAQGGSYTTIARYSQRLLASAQDPEDPRLDGWREFFGQADSDDDVEGWDFRYGEAASSEPSHLWHIHLSEDRDKVTSMDNKLAVLSVLKGETVAQWQGGGGGGAGGTLTGTPADMTGDGRPDLVARWADGTLKLYVHSGNAATPYTSAPRQIGGGWGGMSWIGVADVTGDGWPDVLARSTDGALRLYQHTGNPNSPLVGNGTVIGLGWQAATAITLGDVTLDGKVDIVARLADGTLQQYPNSGNAAAPYRGRVKIGTGWNSVSALTAADVTLDGKVDLVARFPDGTLRRYAHSGNAAAPYSSPVQIGTGWNAITAIVLTDVTLDGKADLVGRFPDGTLRQFPHTGSATAPYSTAPVQIGTGWTTVTALT